MPEVEPRAYDRRKLDGKFWCSVQEESTAGFDDATAFLDPGATPSDVLGLGNLVVVSVLVVLPQVKWGIGKDCIDDAGPQATKDLEAVLRKENTTRGCKIRFRHRVDIHDQKELRD